MPPRLPTVFVSHGAPSLVLEKDDPTHRFLIELGRTLPRPKAMVCVSAHWESPRPRVTAHPRPPTIHDFGRFLDKLYQMRYPAPGAPELARTVCHLLELSGLGPSLLDEERGLDHGAWVPLSLMYPAADIPVIQVSVQTAADPRHHLKIRRALEPLRDQETLILGSGGATHNLREVGRWDGQDAPAAPPSYVRDFDGWLHQSISEGNLEALLDYRKVAPDATRNHPTEEHFLPLFVPLGAAGEDVRGKRVHRGIAHGVLSMAAYGWGI